MVIHTTPGLLSEVAEKLKHAGLRPTKQRLLLGALIWSGEQPRHVTAEQLHNESRRQGVQVSLATVYNTLHQLTADGLLKRVVLDAGKVYFDTNTSDHHHIVNEVTGEIIDICTTRCMVAPIDLPPELAISNVEVIFRVRPAV
jgi:Fur family iron response transcriptional regulator